MRNFIKSLSRLLGAILTATTMIAFQNCGKNFNANEINPNLILASADPEAPADPAVNSNGGIDPKAPIPFCAYLSFKTPLDSNKVSTLVSVKLYDKDSVSIEIFAASLIISRQTDDLTLLPVALNQTISSAFFEVPTGLIQPNLIKAKFEGLTFGKATVPACTDNK